MRVLGELVSLLNSPLKGVLEVNSCTSEEERRQVKTQRCVFIFTIYCLPEVLEQSTPLQPFTAIPFQLFSLSQSIVAIKCYIVTFSKKDAFNISTAYQARCAAHC